MPRGDRVSLHHRPAGQVVRAAATQSSDRRSAGNHSPRLFDGLLYGCGDAVIGINPATDSVSSVSRLLRILDELMRTYGIPTQSCVLAHVTTQMEALRQGAPVDLIFQSVAGTEVANKSFGVNLALLAEAQEAALSLQSRHGRRQRNVF